MLRRSLRLNVAQKTEQVFGVFNLWFFACWSAIHQQCSRGIDYGMGGNLTLSKGWQRSAI